MGSRREGREMALQVLYLSETCNMSLEDALTATLSETGAESSVKKFASHLAAGVNENKPRIDELLVKYAQNWDLKRMAAVDRNILRLSTYEILFDTDTPLSVIIDEAIEVAKTFSTDDSGKFVNGILDKIKSERASAS
ncbi:MAG: transcription antitermination factor NusB [Elusimicrobia bacterium RIFCSPLOWO2_01_FULL_54_10]|nr:MAG: transcription antitermination factor NusB [Elusimicrobia bacterium RIFCSPLOWO2_01_FULL_54_10]